MFVCLLACLFVCLFACLFVCLFVCVCVCVLLLLLLVAAAVACVVVIEGGGVVGILVGGCKIYPNPYLVGFPCLDRRKVLCKMQSKHTEKVTQYSNLRKPWKTIRTSKRQTPNSDKK